MAPQPPTHHSGHHLVSGAPQCPQETVLRPSHPARKPPFEFLSLGSLSVRILPLVEGFLRHSLKPVRLFFLLFS